MLGEFIARYIGVLVDAFEPKRQKEIIDIMQTSFSSNLTIGTIRSYAYRINDVLNKKGAIRINSDRHIRTISLIGECGPKKINDLIIEVYKEIKSINREKSRDKALNYEEPYLSQPKSNIVLPKPNYKGHYWCVVIDKNEIVILCNNKTIGTIPTNEKTVIELSEKAVIRLG